MSNFIWKREVIRIDPAPPIGTIPVQLPIIHQQQQMAFNAMNPSLISTDGFNLFSRQLTTPATPSASANTVATEQRATAKPPVHTIHHTQLSRGKELGQVNKLM